MSGKGERNWVLLSLENRYYITIIPLFKWVKTKEEIEFLVQNLWC